MKQDKIAVILRGVPGSGKSTLVDAFRSLPRAVAIHAVDDLHTDHHGNFLWDEENSERLYTLNFANFVTSCASGISTVICDAINVHVQDFQKYVDIADQYGYCVYVICPNPPTALQSTNRNKHHTSSVQARDMYSRWEHWPTDRKLKELSCDNK